VSAAAQARSTSNVLDEPALLNTNRPSEDCWPWNGLLLMYKLLPTTSSTGAVSPVTRAIASMIPVTIPLAAVGSTTRRIVRHFGTPSAYDASRSDVGTSLIISSHERTTTGSSRIARAIDPAKPENPCLSASTQNASTNKPATIDGMPVITSMRNRIEVASAPLPYSVT
jgi:hypothetical protein